MSAELLHPVQSNLPLFAVLAPLVGTILILLANEKRSQCYHLAVLSNLGSLLALIALIPVVSGGQMVGQAYPWLFRPFGLHMQVGRVGLLMALISGVLWFLATLYSRAYLEGVSKQKRYYAFMQLTLCGCLGVYLTGNLFTLFVFFEILSITPFVLIIYSETADAFRAGYLYLTLSIFGGLVLLLGLILLYSIAGTLELAEVGEHLSQQASTVAWIGGLLIIGFGVKAGIVPLHIWLPEAHPVAPTPISALLSGVMIKAGAYGIYLTLSQVLFSQHEVLENLGYVLAWVGILTMLTGAFSALRQVDAKRLLAYSSVSQMGYIILALGLQTYLGEHGALGFIGGFYHIFNHALFKVGFFLNIGIIYQATHEKRLDRLGGLLRAMPVTALMYLLFAGGIVGVPGFNAYASKTLIHHTITEAIHIKHAAGLQLMEYLFILTGAITFAYTLKMYSRIFWGERPADLQVHPVPYRRMRGVTLPLAILVLLTGLMPKLLLHQLFLPMLDQTGYDKEVATEFLAHFSFWNVHDLLGVVPYFAIGIVLYWLETRRQFFTRLIPKWFGIKQLVGVISRAGANGFKQMHAQVDRGTIWVSGQLGGISKTVAERLVAFDRDPRTSKVGPLSIASLDFSKLWLALVIVIFLLLSLLKVMDLD